MPNPNDPKPSDPKANDPKVSDLKPSATPPPSPTPAAAAPARPPAAPAPGPLAAVAPSRLEALLEMLVQQMALQNSGSVVPEVASPEMALAMKAIEAQIEATKQMRDEFSRTQRRSNAVHLNLSAFTFDHRCAVCLAGTLHDNGERAHPKPALRYDTSFCWGKQMEDALTPLEIELYNSFTESKEARNGTWTATITRVGKTETLHVRVPARDIDQLMVLPGSLSAILGELLFGDSVADPGLASARIGTLEKTMAELMARLKASDDAREAMQRKLDAAAGDRDTQAARPSSPARA